MERTAGGITYTLTRRRVRNINLRAVSYTHLTLPTIA